MSRFSPNDELSTFCSSFGIHAKPVHDEFGVVLYLDACSTEQSSSCATTIGTGREMPLPQGCLETLVEKYGLVIIKGQHQLVQDAATDYVPTMTRLLGRPLENTEDIATLKGAPQVQLLGSPNSSMEPTATFIPAHQPEKGGSLAAWVQDLVACEVTDWHTDEPWDDPPARFTAALCAVSTGFNATQFSSTAALYDRTDVAIREKLNGTKTLFEPPPWLPTEQGKQGRHNTVNDGPAGKSFFICMDATTQIDGMTEVESKELVWNLTRDAMKPEHKYMHEWEEGDLVIWDGASTLHARTLYSHGSVDRVLYRLRVGGGEEQLAADVDASTSCSSSTSIMINNKIKAPELLEETAIAKPLVV